MDFCIKIILAGGKVKINVL